MPEIEFKGFAIYWDEDGVPSMVEAVNLGTVERRTRPYSAVDNAELLHWLKRLGSDSPAKLVAEIRKRRLLAEDELRQWLGTDTGAA